MSRVVVLGLIAVVIAGSCATSDQAGISLDDPGLSVADHTGAILVIAGLEPATLGDNSVRVFLRDASGKPVGGSVRVSLRRGTTEVPGSDAAVGARARLAVAIEGSYELVVAAKPDGQPAGTVRFPLTLPARAPDAMLLARVDAAMNALHGLREAQTLTSGSFVYVFDYDYAAPDRIRYGFVGPDGIRHETVIVGRSRFDSEGHGWVESDLGTSATTATFSFATAPHRVRQVGSEILDGRETLVVALVSGAPPDERYYRLWIDAQDLRVRRYAMMATGHYMGGSYRDFDAPLEISPPTP